MREERTFDIPADVGEEAMPPRESNHEAAVFEWLGLYFITEGLRQKNTGGGV